MLRIGCCSDPIQVIQVLSFLLPTTTFGIIKTDSSSGEKENEAKSTGPVPLPCTEFVTTKFSNCFSHQVRASANRAGPVTVFVAKTPQPTKPSPPRTQASGFESGSKSNNGRCSPSRTVVIGISSLFDTLIPPFRPRSCR